MLVINSFLIQYSRDPDYPVLFFDVVNALMCNNNIDPNNLNIRGANNYEFGYK